MSDQPWEAPDGARRRRWPVVLVLGVAVLVGGLVAGPGMQPRPDGGLAVEEATPEDAGPTTTSPSPGPAVPVADGEWTRLEDAPIAMPGAHLGVWTGSELLVGFQPDVAAYDPASDDWRQLPAVPGPERLEARVVWTGQHVVVFGGMDGQGEGGHRADGWMLNLDTRRWQAIPAAPEVPLWDPTVIWTGEEVVVWGGTRPGKAQELGEWPVRGSAYRPAEGRWRVLPAAPIDNVYFTEGLWTGREMVVWGSHQPPGQQLSSEAGVSFARAYDPATDRWRLLPGPPLENAADTGAVWTGKEVVLWGQPPWRAHEDLPERIGAGLDPRRPEEGWRLLPDVDVADQTTSVYGVAAAWTGQKAFFYGGYPRSIGLLYDPKRESWQRLPAHRARVGAVAAWTGDQLLVWGGYTTTGPDVDLWAFRQSAEVSAGCLPPDTAAPEQLPAGWSWSPPVLDDSVPAVTAWTGDQLLVWGASSNEGVGFDAEAPQRRRCLPPSPLTPPSRAGSTWTPSGLFVWGGEPARADGALYDPHARTWRLLPEAPLMPRLPVAVVWTGEEVLVWGGAVGRRHSAFPDGAAYDPETDTWRRLADAPVALNRAEAVWTGQELIVYGSQLHLGNVATTTNAVGIAYSPATGSWRRLPDHPLSPQASSIAWTGQLLVAWDHGLDAAAYDPATDRWTPLPRLPLVGQECYPASAVVDRRVFAWYCGQAALFDPDSGRWTPLEIPAAAVGAAGPVSTGAAVVLVDEEGLWRYEPSS